MPPDDWFWSPTSSVWTGCFPPFPATKKAIMRLPSYSHTDLFIYKNVSSQTPELIFTPVVVVSFLRARHQRQWRNQNGKMSKILGSTPPTAIIPPFQDVGGCLCSVNNYETYDWLLYPAWLSNKIAERETISSWGTNFLRNIVGERVSSGLLGLRIAPLMSSSTASNGYPGYSRMFQSQV